MSGASRDHRLEAFTLFVDVCRTLITLDSLIITATTAFIGALIQGDEIQGIGWWGILSLSSTAASLLLIVMVTLRAISKMRRNDVSLDEGLMRFGLMGGLLLFLCGLTFASMVLFTSGGASPKKVLGSAGAVPVGVTEIQPQ